MTDHADSQQYVTPALTQTCVMSHANTKFKHTPQYKAYFQSRLVYSTIAVFLLFVPALSQLHLTQSL